MDCLITKLYEAATSYNIHNCMNAIACFNTSNWFCGLINENLLIINTFEGGRLTWQEWFSWEIGTASTSPRLFPVISCVCTRKHWLLVHVTNIQQTFINRNEFNTVNKENMTVIYITLIYITLCSLKFQTHQEILTTVTYVFFSFLVHKAINLKLSETHDRLFEKL